jgi:hypothetical protein
VHKDSKPTKTTTTKNDPCNYYGKYICVPNTVECDSEKFDCWSDCDDGSVATPVSALEMMKKKKQRIFFHVMAVTKIV